MDGEILNQSAVGMWLLMSGAVGAAVAQARRGSLWKGFCWGLVLGPIGWIIVAVIDRPPASTTSQDQARNVPSPTIQSASQVERRARLRQAAIAAPIGSLQPAAPPIDPMEHASSSPYDDLGVAGDYPISSLEDAIEKAATISIAYFGGREPGAIRQIAPREIEGDFVQAFCIASDHEQTYRLSRMAIPKGPAHRAYLIVLSSALRAAAGVAE